VRRYRPLLILWFVTACASLSNVVPDTVVLEKLAMNKEGIHSMRGMGNIYFRLNNKKGSVDTVLLASKKGNLRLETGNHFGVPLMAMTIQNKKLSYYVIPEEKLYVGDAAELSTRVLPLGITEKDLPGLLFFSKETYLRFKKRAGYKIEFFEIELDTRSKMFYPKGFKITDVKTEEYIAVSWDAFDINPAPFSEALFQIKPGSQVRVYEWKGGKLTPAFQGFDEVD